MENIITFQTTYYNSLRDYIKSLDNIKDIIDVTYGVDIPEEYQSEVLKILYKANNEE
jgi:hypothetical protein